MAISFNDKLVKEALSWWFQGSAIKNSTSFIVAPYKGGLAVIGGAAAIILAEATHPFDLENMCIRWSMDSMSEERFTKLMPKDGICLEENKLENYRLFEETIDKKRKTFRVFIDSTGTEYVFDDDLLKRMLYEADSVFLYSKGIGANKSACYLCRLDSLEPYGIIMPYNPAF